MTLYFAFFTFLKLFIFLSLSLYSSFKGVSTGITFYLIFAVNDFVQAIKAKLKGIILEKIR